MTEKAHSHIGKYLGVFGALLVLTAITVSVSKFHIPIFVVAVVIAMVVAITKGSLVAAFFMHLVGENKFVYLTLMITVVFFALLLLVPSLTFLDDYRIQLP